jgi:hypothetical protein
MQQACSAASSAWATWKFRFPAQVGRAEAHREQHALEAVDDVGQRVARGELAVAGFAVAALRLAPLLARRAAPAPRR